MTAACDVYRDLEAAAENTPAHTVDGLRAKARMLSRNIRGQLVGSGAEAGFDSLLADLEAIVGGKVATA